jgi:hypothetical protein
MSSRPPALPTQKAGRSALGLSCLKIVVFVVGLVVLFIGGQWVLSWLVVHGLYRLLWGNGNDLTDLNPYLLKAIGWSSALVVAYSISLRKAKRLNRWWLLGLLPVIFNAGIYLLSKALYFRFSDGAPLQWAAETDHGVDYYAKPGFGPDGKPLVRVTAENFKRFKDLGGGRSAVDPEHVDWFSPDTGKASIYYCKSSNGDYEFFDRFAHNPATGQELHPVTAEVRAEYEAWRKERLEREIRVETEEAQLEEKKGADDARESRLRELRTLFKPIITDSNNVNVALVVMCDSNSDNCDQVSQQLLSGLQSAAPKIVFLPDYCTSDFIEKGYFEKAYQGDASAIKEADGLCQIDYLLLCKVKSVTVPSSAARNSFTCRIDLGFLLLDRDGKQANRGNLQVAGPGLSEELAVQRGMASLTEQYSSQFLPGLTGKSP